jgi:hypothetical protein
MAKVARREQNEDLIKAYKRRLGEIIDRRPSGTRQRLADALGKHRSFVTQMTSNLYPTPVPERHLGTIFSVCHFSAEERRQFLEDYRAAHPERAGAETEGVRLRHVSLTVVDLGNEAKNHRFDEAIAEIARRMGALFNTDAD